MVAKTLPFVDYAFFSISGVEEEAKTFLVDVYNQGPQVVVATFGSKGSLAFDGAQFYPFGIFQSTVENTVGAGDAFIAGFMAGILSGTSIIKSLEAGAKIAAKVVGTFEPWVKNK